MFQHPMLKAAVAVLCAAGLVQPALADPVSEQMLARDPADSWLHTNGNWAGHRYSTLSQLHARNVKDLKVAWITSVGAKTDSQATPLYHDGLIYFPQDNKVFAISADNGSIVWRYEHKLPDDWGGYNVPFFTGKHRGVAIHGEHIYFLSNDNKLHALHYKTGKASFVKGYEEAGIVYPKDFSRAGDSNGYISTVGPIAVQGAILLPMNGTDTGGLEGFVLGVSPKDGSLLWKANMIPRPDEPGGDTWPPGSTTYGGAGPWITGSYDPELKMYFTGTANAYEWNPKNRGGGEMDNVGAASIVAVNTETGEVAWRYVGVPGDPFDFDIPQTPMVIDIGGRKTIVQPNKTGFIHHLDARTGRFLRADRFSDRVNWISGYDASGRPKDMLALPPEGGDPIEVAPGLLGGVNMYPNAYNPNTGHVYLAASESSMNYGFEDIKVISNVRHFGAYQEFNYGDEVDKAVNVKTGKEVWRDTQAGKPGYAGGMLTTAGNLVIYTTQGGRFTVADARSGERLFELETGIAAKSGPITFTHKGKQMIVQPLGGTPGFGRDEAHGLEFGHAIIAFTR